MTEFDKLVHMALHALQCPESITPEARADLAGKIDSALAANAGDAAELPADELRLGLGQIAVRVADDPVMVRCCRLIDERLAAPAAPQVAAREPSPTAGMNLAQRILHVGGRNPPGSTYVEFGSIQAVEALVRQVLRDLPAAPLLFGLGQSDAGGAAHVDQLVPMPADGAKEVAPVLVNVGLDGSEHDARTAGSALPHCDSPSDAPEDAAGVRQDGVGSAAPQVAAAPEAYKLVPVEPTPAMVAAAEALFREEREHASEAHEFGDTFMGPSGASYYLAMIAAAPEVAAPPRTLRFDLQEDDWFTNDTGPYPMYRCLDCRQQHYGPTRVEHKAGCRVAAALADRAAQAACDTPKGSTQ